MSKDGREPIVDADAVKSLNEPVPIEVRAERDTAPHSVRIGRRWIGVSRVTNAWRIDEGWWRKTPIHRVYYRLLLSDGLEVTVFQDLDTTSWYRQKA